MEYTESQIKTTPLHRRHLDLGAKMTEFCGWAMPVHYGSLTEEHRAVRRSVGVFDVSHMGQVEVSGPDAERFLDFLSTNTVAGKRDGSAIYTVWCHEDGGCVDDVIIFRESAVRLWVVVNAGNREKDLAHLKKWASGYEVVIRDDYTKGGILAVQGPMAAELLRPLFPETANMPPMRVLTTAYKSWAVKLSSTAYTGAGGFEIFGDAEALVDFWEWLMARDVQPVGLGARDTLRLEMGFALYGHELSDKISPLETVSAWTVKLRKEKFLGKDACGAPLRRQVGLVLRGRGILREGYSVYHHGTLAGEITSGTFSPTLQKGIGIAFVPCQLKAGDEVEVEIRRARVAADIVDLPFLKKSFKE